MSVLDQFGRRVQLLSEERRLTRNDVATLVDLTASQLGRIERGERSTRTEIMVRLARVFLIDVADLFVFPWTEQLRHRARELIRFVPNEHMAGLVEVMERYVEELNNRDEQAAIPLRHRRAK